ncbi:hypothetical protein Bbelb_351830 [Branchiostoma belcheri]|nr:hypothetical protein Bbelb_351830 [Branchiostoma belcheri]
MDEEQKRKKEQALLKAALQGDTVRVKQLLEEGVNPNATSTTSVLWAAQNSPLHLAALNGHHETVSVLLAAGADVNTQDTKEKTPLHLAAKNGHHETVSVLLAAGADVNTQDQWERTPLHLAAVNGHHETVSALLAAGADVNTQDKLTMTSLHWAVLSGHHETVSALLAAGADVNTQGVRQNTPLHLAAGRGHHETVSALLAAGADVNTEDSGGDTPLQVATEQGHSKCVEVLMQHKAKEEALLKAALQGDTVRVKQLLEEGVNPNHTDFGEMTPLHLAAENGHHETVSVLLAAGADVNIQDKRRAYHWTPLHQAAGNGHHETVSVLLAAGAEIDSSGGGEYTSLHWAARNGHHETVSALLAAGADVNIQCKMFSVKDSFGHSGVLHLKSSIIIIIPPPPRTPLHLAAENGHHRIVSAFLTAGANVNAEDGEQNSPLHLAAENGHCETVSVLLAAGADVNTQDRMKRTPLHLGAENGHHETVSVLLAAGADVNTQDTSEMTPLHWAARNGHHETVSVLLAAGADVNTQDQWKRTPLHWAARNGHHETVSVLLAAGADVNTQDSEGKTPLQDTTERGHSKCTELLLQHGADEGGKKAVSIAELKEDFDPVLVHFYEERGMIHATSKGPLVEEAANQTGKTIDQVVDFITTYMYFLMSKGEGEQKSPPDDSGDMETKKSSATNFQQILESILSELNETDLGLLLQVWSARPAQQESPGMEMSPELMKTEYIKTGDLGMLEKDMIAAGISFLAIAQDISEVPEELKYTRTEEATVGPMGGEVEIPDFVKLVVPKGALRQDSKITISMVDVPGILRDPEGVSWTSGYPWSLSEDTCPRELLDQVLFSPAVDVNLHGAQLLAPLEVQTWRPPGSEGMGCFLLKHHDGEGWTDITASTVHQTYPDKVSFSLQTFSPVVTGFAPLDKVISVGKMLIDALTSRTLDCLFAAYIKPSLEDVEFHVVCRDKCVDTDEYLPDFTKCGSNAAMFDLFHGEELHISVNVRGRQSEHIPMVLRSKQCCEKNGQNIQMLLERPHGNRRVKGDVIVKKVQKPLNQIACQFVFKEEGDILPSSYKGDSTIEEPDSTQPTSTNIVESVRPKEDVSIRTGSGDRVHLSTEPQPEPGPCGNGTDNAAGSGNQPVVLLITDEYGNSLGDASTIDRQMAALLVSKGAKVYSLVLSTTKDNEDDAAADGVQLIIPTTFEGDERRPNLNWLRWDHQTRYPNLPLDVGFIIGHVNITSRAARQIKELRLPGAKLVQVTSVVPEETSHFEGDERVMSIGEESDSILDDLQHADVIFSVGPLVHDYYKHQTKQLKLQHHEFLPKPSDIFSKMQLKHVNTETKVVLSIGKIKGAESLKGYDIAAKIMNIVIERLPYTKWQVFGVSPEDFPESKKFIQANVDKNRFSFTPLNYTTQKELSKVMQKANVILMPSRAEPFGLVGLEAIAAGIPVLVSDKSGLAWFLRNQGPEFDRLIVEIADDDHEAAKTLAKRIINMLNDGSREFQAARSLKEKLLASNYWDASHSKFLKEFGL